MSVILTEQAPGRPYGPPICFEPPWPLVTEHELWIAQAGPATWGGAEVGVSEDDDDYEYVGSLAASITIGMLEDPLPALPIESLGRMEGVCVHLELFGERTLPSATPAQAARMGSPLRIGDEILAYSHTELVEKTARGYRYRLNGYMVRGGYGTGRTADGAYTAHEPGAMLVRLDRAVFRYAYPARLVGGTLFVKLAAKNAFGDPDATEDPGDVEPIVVALRGVVEARPAWRSLR